MNRILNYPIKQQTDTICIRDFLRSLGYSSHIITHLKKTSIGICVNGYPSYMNHILGLGETLTVTIAETISSENILPAKMNLNIVYEDEDILVINKPSDTPIHPSQNNHENTLANGIAYYFNAQGLPYVFRCVNRLDRDTTGLTLLAKNMLSSAVLSKMVKKQEIHRTYLAVVTGDPGIAGSIHAPIGRMPGSIIERCVDFISGSTAVTHYEKLAENNGYSLLSVTLGTGRTHQIRIHMKYIGHPLPGDYLYNPDYRMINRQALHSCCLSFLHPITKEPCMFKAPIPADFQSFSFYF